MGVDQLTPRLVGGGQGDERGGAFGAHAVAQAAQFGDAVDGDTGSLATTTLPLADRQREPRGAEGALAAPALRADAGHDLCRRLAASPKIHHPRRPREERTPTPHFLLYSPQGA